MIDKKELMKKLLLGEDDEKIDPRVEMKKMALKQVMSAMSKKSGEDMFKALKPKELLKDAKASVTVATDDPKKLPEALETAKEVVETMPKGLADLAKEEPKKEKMLESDDLDLEDLDEEMLKKLLEELD